MNTHTSEYPEKLTRSSSATFAFWLEFARRLILLVDGPPRPYSDPRDPLLLPADIFSDGRPLDARFVGGLPQPRASVLIFHGLGDRLFYWKRAQFYLAEAGISSLVFHYSGYGSSPGATSPENLRSDALAAYLWLVNRTGGSVPIFVLGFSLGSGLVVHTVRALMPQPRGVILCQAYPTIRRGAARIFGPLARLLPDVWRSTDTIARLGLPLLIVHSDADRLFPLSMGRELFAAAKAGNAAPVELAIPHGHPHNWIYAAVPPDYWAPILDFINRFSQKVA